MPEWLRKLFHREPVEWRMVKTHVVKITRDAGTNDQESGKFYYHLYESNTNKRRVDFGCSLTMTPHQLSEAGHRWDDYHEKILPWLGGRYVPGIPSFSDIDAIDVQAKLSQ